jgi:hypothetical protein
MDAEMNARTQKLNTRSSEQALAAFVAKKAEIDAMLARTQALSDDHFGYSPDEITWGHVGHLPASERDDPPLQRDLQGSEGPNRPLGQGRTAFRRSRSAFGQLSA